MADILTPPAPYPWHEEWARQLHQNIVLVHPSTQDAVLIAKEAKVKTHLILTEQPIFFLWKDILERATIDGVLRPLVTFTRDMLSEENAYRAFFNTLLNNRQPDVNPQRVASNGDPGFNDTVGAPEALLYHEDLTIQIGKVPSLVKTLQALVAISPAICKLIVDINGAPQNGTAFHIGNNTLLTNWHVLHNKKDGTPASAVTAEFGYDDNGAGGYADTTKYACNVATIVANKNNDWGIVSTVAPLPASIPILKLSDAQMPVVNNAAFIIQHPLGESKRVGFVRNRISAFDHRVVHYLTDTQEGSSGAPVFNAEGALIALHHWGGRPQVIPGKPPLKKNEGILISRIVQDMTDANILS